MTQHEIIRKNLLELIADNNTTQHDVAVAIKVSPQTFNNWCKGKSIPRMNRIQALADYFGVPKSAIIDPKPDPVDVSLQEAFERPEMRALFDVAKSASKKDVETAIKFIEALRK